MEASLIAGMWWLGTLVSYFPAQATGTGSAYREISAQAAFGKSPGSRPRFGLVSLGLQLRPMASLGPGSTAHRGLGPQQFRPRQQAKVRPIVRSRPGSRLRFGLSRGLGPSQAQAFGLSQGFCAQVRRIATVRPGFRSRSRTAQGMVPGRFSRPRSIPHGTASREGSMQITAWAKRMCKRVKEM